MARTITMNWFLIWTEADIDKIISLIKERGCRISRMYAYKIPFYGRRRPAASVFASLTSFPIIGLFHKSENGSGRGTVEGDLCTLFS